jgi:hypothetical protein
MASPEMATKKAKRGVSPPALVSTNCVVTQPFRTHLPVPRRTGPGWSFQRLWGAFESGGIRGRSSPEAGPPVGDLLPWVWVLDGEALTHRPAGAKLEATQPPIIYDRMCPGDSTQAEQAFHDECEQRQEPDDQWLLGGDGNVLQIMLILGVVGAPVFNSQRLLHPEDGRPPPSRLPVARPDDCPGPACAVDSAPHALFHPVFSHGSKSASQSSTRSFPPRVPIRGCPRSAPGGREGWAG